jgi:hypothetical protein
MGDDQRGMERWQQVLAALVAAAATIFVAIWTTTNNSPAKVTETTPLASPSLAPPDSDSTPESRTQPTTSPITDSADEQTASDISGVFVDEWEGTLTQESFGTPTKYPIFLSITGGGLAEVVGSTDYPTLGRGAGCSGTLILIEATEQSLTLIERMPPGSSCSSEVPIILELNSDEALTFAVSRGGSIYYDISGTLRRSE